jgi:hypothetical protein
MRYMYMYVNHTTYVECWVLAYFLRLISRYKKIGIKLHMMTSVGCTLMLIVNFNLNTHSSNDKIK